MFKISVGIICWISLKIAWSILSTVSLSKSSEVFDGTGHGGGGGGGEDPH